MKPVEFLEHVWGEEEAYVDLPAKVNGRWVPGILEWPANGAAARRIRSSVRDGEDIYFTPGTFDRPARAAESIRGTHWLWADLDTVSPDALEVAGLTPTVCWRSSPGRYQALWRLKQRLSPRVQEELNRRLTYAVGADKGGWDLTQVLRVPGTRNFKYEGAPPVTLLWADGPEYEAKRLWKKLTKSGRVVSPPPLESPSPSRTPTAATRPETLGDGKTTRGLSSRRDLDSTREPSPKIPRRAVRLLNTPPDQVVMGERSARLWELECLLVEGGFEDQEIYELIWPSAWNKWREIRTGGPRLKREITKARRHVETRRASREHPVGHPASGADDGATGQEKSQDLFTVVEPEGERLPFENYADFMARKLEEPRWLVNEIWSAGSHGIFGGEPKTNKSTLTLALALSVASGKPFLGEYPVGVSGPALIIQEENAPWQVQDRLRKLASFYGLLGKEEVEVRKARRGSLGRRTTEVVHMPDDVPLRLLNNWGFDLSEEEHREALEAEIEELAPVLVVLDPLYLMLGTAEEERSAHLRPFLKWLLYLRYTYNCAIPVVHHFRKAREGLQTRPGQRILGSATLHGWVDSAVYCEALPTERDQESRLRVEREFRNVGPRKPFELRLRMGRPGDLRFDCEFSEYNLTGQLVSLVVEAGPQGITASEVGKQLGVDKRTILSRARGSGKVKVVAGKKGRGYSHKLIAAKGVKK